MTDMPLPSCELGYTDDDLAQILGQRFSEFKHWMRGQTIAVCEGRRYDHGRQVWLETGCGPHGPATYGHDLRRFLAGGPIID